MLHLCYVTMCPCEAMMTFYHEISLLYLDIVIIMDYYGYGKFLHAV